MKYALFNTVIYYLVYGIIKRIVSAHIVVV
jgi:hypothetical protein